MTVREFNERMMDWLFYYAAPPLLLVAVLAIVAAVVLWFGEGMPLCPST